MAIHLTLILSGKPYEEHDFDFFQRLRIGRSEDCELRIDNLGVSRYQCEIVNLGGTYQLRALSESQATLLNGTPVKSIDLTDGDGIGFGKFTVAFYADAAWSTIVSGSSTEGGNIGEATLGDAAAAERAREESMDQVRGYVAVGTEDERDKRHVLKGAFFRVGKDSDADVSLSGWSAPRLGALIVRDETGFRIIDVSPKGDMVKLNGKGVHAGRLSHGDRIDVYKQPLMFFSGSPPE